MLLSNSRVHNRKWRKCCCDWLILCRGEESRSPIGRTQEPWIFFFFLRPRLIDAHISIIYSAPNELLKRKVWFYLLGYSIFNAEEEKKGWSLSTTLRAVSMTAVMMEMKRKFQSQTLVHVNFTKCHRYLVNKWSTVAI